ncbi:hypothetical protein F0562_026903 [Nyssa sinensis]|uniref:RING-type E3 ubiquitin transferase n=1 Tax=Nyssa sinensis TaxID=561372 RepID=A0A5J5B473_9ASTE|nr:hypothetical protein F0562_026903 [Nyssa sinensis]
MMTTLEGKEEEESEIEEEENISNPSNPPERMDLIQELVGVIDSVKSFGDYRRTQKKESHSLVRRMKLLLPLLEEIGDVDRPIPEACIACLNNLKKAFLSAKRLLKICNDGSKLYLALESEAITVRFHSVYDKLSQGLDGMPYDELGISDEVKEQVELMHVQLRRAKRRTDTQDMELAMDMMVLSTKDDDRNVDSASIERLANKLSLHTVEDLKTETIAIRKLVKERGGQHAESTQQIIDLLNRFKQIVGVEETNVLDDPVMPKTLEKCPSLAIPHEFLCPITLEIMTDPVIIATGQTYERESIQYWLDSNHRTCPKTGQALVHLSLAPNFALRNLILQWCEKNNFQLPKKDDLASSENSSDEQREKILSLVQNLSSSHLEVQRKTVMKIRMLSKESPESRILIANCGGIPALVHLLSYPDSRIQEHAVTALLNLSIDELNKKLITREEPIPAIIEVLQNGCVGAKENSAAALFSLSMLDENKVMIGLSNGIPPLVDLLQNGTIRGKKDAATALFNLSLNQANKTRAIEAGVVKPLLPDTWGQKLRYANLLKNTSISLEPKLPLLKTFFLSRRPLLSLSDHRPVANLRSSNEMINSELNSNGLDNNGAGMPVYHKQPPVAIKKIALRDVQNDNRSFIHNLSRKFTSAGGKTHCRCNQEVGKGRVQDITDKNADCFPSSSMHFCHKQQEIPQQQTLMRENNRYCVPGVTPNRMASMMSFSYGGPSLPLSLGKPGNGLPVVESNCLKVTSDVDHSIDSKATDDQQRKERFLCLQKFLKHCDESNQRDYTQTDMQVELEKRAIQLTIEEGKEIQRMKALNILGKSGPMSNPLQMTQQYQSKK